MSGKKSFKGNVQKGETLTAENEAYFNQMVVYIRLHQVAGSEQKIDEVLAEMLDLLLQGQNEGKTAAEVFGDDPLAYANQIIGQLARQQKRDIIPLFIRLILQLAAFILIFRGIVLPIMSLFKEVDSTVNIFVVVVVSLLILCTILCGGWLIFKILFRTQKSTNMDALKAGLVSAAAMAIIFLAIKYTPEIGPTYNFPWWASLIVGGVLGVIAIVVKRKRH